MSTHPTNTTISPKVARGLTKEALATSLGVSVRTVENMVKKKMLPPGERVGRFLQWEETVLAKWQERMFAVQRGWQP